MSATDPSPAVALTPLGAAGADDPGWITNIDTLSIGTVSVKLFPVK